MKCGTDGKQRTQQIAIRFQGRDSDLSVAIPALASVRKQTMSVVVKSLLREALRNVTDLPDNVKGLVA